MWKCKVQIKCKMGICEVQDATPTTLADREHKSTLGKSTRLSISKISLSCLYPNWTQILSVINLQRESGTAPPSRVSSRQHPPTPHSPPPGECSAYMCVYVYYYLWKYTNSFPVLPYSQCPNRSIHCVRVAEGYEC